MSTLFAFLSPSCSSPYSSSSCPLSSFFLDLSPPLLLFFPPPPFCLYFCYSFPCFPSFLSAAKPTGHRTVHVLLLVVVGRGETTFYAHVNFFLGVFWSQPRASPSLLCSPALVPLLSEHTYFFHYISPTIIIFPSSNNDLFLTDQTPQVNEQILFLFRL